MDPYLTNEFKIFEKRVLILSSIVFVSVYKCSPRHIVPTIDQHFFSFIYSHFIDP